MEKLKVIIPPVRKDDHTPEFLNRMNAMLKLLTQRYGQDFVDNNTGELTERLREERENYEKEVSGRIALWQSLLGKYWKLTVVNGDGTSDDYGYVYPYEILKDNDTVFMLLSGIGDPYGYKSGVQEHSFNMFETYAYFTLVFEETDRAAMEANALSSSTDVIDRRIIRQTEKLKSGDVTEDGFRVPHRTQMSTPKSMVQGSAKQFVRTMGGQINERVV